MKKNIDEVKPIAPKLDDEPQHTPTPWYMSCGYVWAGAAAIAKPFKSSYLADDEEEANMRFIVTACNGYAQLIAKNKMLHEALVAAVERMEAVSESIPVENRAVGISQATHVRHMARHLAQHAKIARAALAQCEGVER